MLAIWMRRLFSGSCVILVGGLLILLVNGCKPATQKLAEQETALNYELQKITTMIQDASYSEPSEALKLIDEALSNPQFIKHTHLFFPQKINLLLSMNRPEEAAALMLETWRTSPELARTAFGYVAEYYLRENRYADLRSWCEKLHELGTNFPKNLRPSLATWRLKASLGAGDFKTARQDIDDLITLYKPDECVVLLKNALNQTIDSGKQQETLLLLEDLAKQGPKQEVYQQTFTTLILRCLVIKKDWPLLMPPLNDAILSLPDDQLFGTLKLVFDALKKDGQQTFIEQTSKQTVFNAAGKQKSVNYAARLWVDISMAKDKKVLADRLNVLLNVDVSPVLIADLFERYFYEMIDNQDVMRNLCAVGTRMLSVCKDETQSSMIKVKLLDGAFILNDFDKAIEMLEQGIPGRDEKWHEMSIPKIKAHRAMAQNKPREAVQYFREFMNVWIATGQEEEFDPPTGIAHSRDWILGRNAIRIAQLLESIPDKVEADKARDEAKTYFMGALQKAENDPLALQTLKKEIKTLGLNIPL